MPSVGVIIKLERDALQILDNNNKIQAKRPSDVTLQRKGATAVALDSEQQTIGEHLLLAQWYRFPGAIARALESVQQTVSAGGTIVRGHLTERAQKKLAIS